METKALVVIEIKMAKLNVEFKLIEKNLVKNLNILNNSLLIIPVSTISVVGE